MPFTEYYVFALLAALPVAYVFRYAGFSPFWAALLFIPEAGLIACASFLALRKWPAAGEV